jgi:cytoskeletal protein RodZ
VSIGETLAAQRREAGLTVSQVSSQTRIRESVIRAIERNDFTPCGGNFYARGHIKGIARVVGTDPDPLIREYDETHGGSPEGIPAAQALEPAIPVRFGERRSPNWSAAMAIALVVVVVFGVVRVVNQKDESHSVLPARAPATTSQRPQPPPPTPSPTRSDSVAMAPRTDVTVRIRAKQTTWVNVRDSKNKQLFGGLIREGDVKEWTVKKRIRLLIGNSSGVVLIVNDKNLGSPGGKGQVLRISFGPGDPGNA